MTLIVRKLWSFTAILIFSVTVNADLVPKKLLEIDFGKLYPEVDLTKAYLRDYNERSGNIFLRIYLGPPKELGSRPEGYYYWINSDGDYLRLQHSTLPKTFGSSNPPTVLSLSSEQLVIAVGRSIYLFKRTNAEITKVSKYLINDNERFMSNNNGHFQERGVELDSTERLATAEDLKLKVYDIGKWVESEGGEGGNSEPQIMFSKITPNEVTIKGETTKGGTIERSTDLKNWKKLVRVSKGGFEVFVDPTEKNKEFFRVKTE